MRGIILAGGKGTRLYPITKGVCKQLLPVYDKPMVYYPLSVLMLAGIRDVLVISSVSALDGFKSLLGSGSDLGMNISYARQPEPKGIPEALIIAEEFIGKERVCLILGDNIFFGHGLPEALTKAVSRKEGATIFGYYVKDPQRYGIVEFDRNEKIISLEEKPAKPKSNWAITGLYFYDNRAVDIAKAIKPSKRGELEITDVNRDYLDRGKLNLELLGRGFAWLDTGTFDSLIDASMFIKTLEERQGLKVGCIEEVSYRMGYIDRNQLKNLADSMDKGYGQYLLRIMDE
ncbi:MAG: glucose-1-phosphate thymidylyltransferase RfbA [Candidatus Omnitrophica bacterium]|nr:glucose-1-phosphate thymidylyltransferase RfbA [Candidatus Omnitrophota bacterium]